MTSTDFNSNVDAPQADIAYFLLRFLCLFKKFERNIHEFDESDPAEADFKTGDWQNTASVDIRTGSLAFRTAICIVFTVQLKEGKQ